MLAFFSWAYRRLQCALRGHRMTSDRIYYAPAKSVTPGYRCTRCEKTQALLYRWQDCTGNDNE